ncbi:hypothetical protein LTR10_007460 [Elasticomyces elasticus]|nr:hypothetical protein LTR10_007460 [Elasticomyces elasticus]
MASPSDQTPKWSLRRRSPKAVVMGVCVAAVIGTGGFTWAVSSSLRTPSSSISRLDAQYFPKCARFLSNEEISAEGAGYVVIPEPEDFGLNESAPSLRVKGAFAYQAAVVHQLHCLASIRDTLVRLEIGERDFLEDSDHPFHCLDYLRQSVQCAGDLALDAGVPFRLNNGRTSWSYTGMNAVHSCRDWDVVKEFLADHGDSDFAGSILDT